MWNDYWCFLMSLIDGNTRTLIHERFELFNSNTKRYFCGKYLHAWLDECFSFLMFGASPDDYYRYQFFKKSFSERNQFITFLRSKRIIRKYNDKSFFPMMNDKRLLNAFLEPFLGREWLDLSKVDDDAFYAFLAKYGRIIMKPYGGSGGKGIFIVDISETGSSQIRVSDYRDYIAEELLHQHPDLERINPSSVNTLRVMTFQGEIISATLKVGQHGAVVDNMCSNGLYGNIDLETGITDSYFMDIGLSLYERHPETQEKLIGISIPNWSMVQDTVKQAAQLLEKVQYVGWDVAVLKDRVAIIEANEAPGHDLSIQSSKQQGLYQKIKTIEQLHQR